MIEDYTFDDTFITILEALPEATIVSDPSGKIIFVNSLAEILFGYTKTEFLNLSVEDLMPIDFRMQHEEYKEKYLKKPFAKKMTMGHININSKGLKNNAEEFLIDVSLSPITLNNKLLILSGIKDLTERELYERQLKEKTAELAKQTTLVHLAEEHSQEREKFVDTICHEIRNPLHGINGGISLLEESFFELEKLYKIKHPKLFEKIKREMDIVTASITQQKSIVNDVLTISKLENKGLTLDIKCFELTELLKQTSNIFTVQIKEKLLKLIFNLPQNLTFIKTDPHQLSQIIINLISNAIKFTEQGSITCSVILSETLDSYNDENIKINFTIEDTGIGMLPEELDKLFSRFSQANSSISSKYGGSGLGLTICKKIIELMNGKIEITSKLGAGTTFSFFIIAGRTSKEEIEITKNHDIYKQLSIITPPNLNNKKILIVEDNKINMLILVEMLKNTNCFYVTANNAKNALKHFEQNNFNLIFMDLELDGLSGIEVTKQIREKETCLSYRTIIICISGHTRQSIKNKALSSGMDDYLSKPFTKKSVFELLTKYLSDQKSPSMSTTSSGLITSKKETFEKTIYTPFFSNSSTFTETPESSCSNKTIKINNFQTKKSKDSHKKKCVIL